MSANVLNPTTAKPSFRTSGENANHHLWNNHGTWFLHYTVYPTPFTKERIRRSLGTKDLAVARQRRDVFFTHLFAERDVAGRNVIRLHHGDGINMDAGAPTKTTTSPDPSGT